MTRYFLPDTVVRFPHPDTKRETTGTIVRLRCGPLDCYEITAEGGERVLIALSQVQAVQAVASC